MVVPSIEYFNTLVFGRRKAIEVNCFPFVVDRHFECSENLSGAAHELFGMPTTLHSRGLLVHL